MTSAVTDCCHYMRVLGRMQVRGVLHISVEVEITEPTQPSMMTMSTAFTIHSASYGIDEI